MSEIIVFTEKHSHRYFDASTREKKAQAFARVLRERYAEGYWYHPQYTRDEMQLNTERQALMSMTEEQISVLPASMQEDLRSKRHHIARMQKAYKHRKAQEDEWFAAAKQVADAATIADAAKLTVADAEGRWGSRFESLAEAVLDVRKDYEYEDYFIEKLE